MNRKKFSYSATNYVESIGKNFPCPSLPQDYPWKVLSALHADLASFLNEDENMLLSQIIRDRDFDAYLYLEEVWGLQAINVLPQTDSAACSARYQLATLIKKYQFPTNQKMRRDAALKKFRDAEQQCLWYNRTGYRALLKGSDFNSELITYAQGFLVKLLGTTCPTKEILTRWSRHGPGANLDTKKGLSNEYFKFENWPYSCTRAALPYAHYLISTDKRWLGALEDSYRERNNIPKHEILNQSVFWENVFRVVEGNRIAFVPKSAIIDRTIAIEPAMNLVLQLGVDGFIRNRLKRFGINLDSQEKNQRMARLGSLRDDNKSFVTLDLAAASDTISLRICKLLLPDDWYDYLLKLRSPSGDVEGETFSYEKISSMGCGFTFVLESAIFAALVYAAHRASNNEINLENDIAIYGDDLIVRKVALPFVLRALNLGGFKINSDKSFYEGSVRESCGTDWLMGHDLRPTSIKELPKDIPGLFTDRNRLKMALEVKFGIRVSQAVRLVENWIPPKFRLIQGPYSTESFDSFLHTRLCDVRFSLYSNKLNSKSKVRWKYGYWFFPILTKRAKRISGDCFLFRKLMHNLSSDDRPKGYGNELKRTSSGSRFTVVKSHSSTVGLTVSETSYWSSDYFA